MGNGAYQPCKRCQSLNIALHTLNVDHLGVPVVKYALKCANCGNKTEWFKDWKTAVELWDAANEVLRPCKVCNGPAQVWNPETPGTYYMVRCRNHYHKNGSTSTQWHRSKQDAINEWNVINEPGITIGDVLEAADSVESTLFKLAQLQKEAGRNFSTEPTYEGSDWAIYTNCTLVIDGGAQYKVVTGRTEPNQSVTYARTLNEAICSLINSYASNNELLQIANRRQREEIKQLQDGIDKMRDTILEVKGLVDRKTQ